MKKRAGVFAVTLGLSVFAFGSGSAVADPSPNNQSGNSAQSCAGFGNVGQVGFLIGDTGRNRTQTPPEFVATIGQPSVGAAINTFCSPPAG